MDNLTPRERSAQMALVRSRDTKPEMKVRRFIYKMGYRYRLHRSDLPGKPDIVFSSRKKIIFIHGCFWHGHSCSLGRIPKTRVQFWTEKITTNKIRDEKTLEKLKDLGWAVLVLWECQLKHGESLGCRVGEFLG